MRSWKEKSRRLMALLLALVMLGSLAPELGLVTRAEAAVTSTADWTLLDGNKGSTTLGAAGTTTYYYLTANTSYTGVNATNEQPFSDHKATPGLKILGNVYI